MPAKRPARSQPIKQICHSATDREIQNPGSEIGANIIHPGAVQSKREGTTIRLTEVDGAIAKLRTGTQDRIMLHIRADGIKEA